GQPVTAVTFSPWVSASDPSAHTGTFVLHLTGSDGALQASDDVTITVVAPANQPPTVNAGADQTLTRPTNVATLTGSVSDDGLPVGGPASVLWTKVSGPGTV